MSRSHVAGARRIAAWFHQTPLVPPGSLLLLLQGADLQHEQAIQEIPGSLLT